MKKRNLNNKKVRLLSVGLLASSAVLSVTDVQPIVAKEADNNAVEGSEEQEEVAILSSTKESETTESTVEGTEISQTDPSEETSTTTDSSETSTSSSDATDSTQDSSTSDSSTSTTNSSTSTSSSSTTSSSSSTTSSSTTSSSSTKPSTSKPKPQPTTPSQPAVTAPPVQGPVQQPSTTPQPSSPSGTSGNNVSSSGSTASDQIFHVSPNLTTKNFIEVIGEDARTIAGENNLYASVMIAQAILESASGNSALASSPNYNLFGIKGSFEGESANFLTSEDNGSGSMFTIRSDFRKYPSYKESLEDYVKLLQGGTDFNDSFYKGTWKTNTKTYKDATKYLTGRYATDTNYNAKLNGLIDAYDLTEYDTMKDSQTSKKAKKITLNTSFDKIEKQNDQNDKKIEYVNHIVEKGESLRSISELYNISTLAILEKNQLDRRMLFIGQKLNIPKEEDNVTVVLKEEAVDRSLGIAQKLSNAFTGKNTTETTAKKETTTATTKESKEYQVSATRKKTNETYEVKKGDTLASISKKTGVSVLSLKEWNDLDQYFLTEGQQLILSPVYDLQS